MAKNVKTTAPKNEIDEAVKESVNFVEKHKNALIYGTVAVLAVALGLLLFLNHRSKSKAENEQKASYALTQYNPNDSINANVAANVVSQYDGTATANQARILAARQLYDEAKYQEAADMLEGYDYCGDELVGPQALCMLGDCYAALKQYDKACSQFEKAAEKANNYIVSPAALQKAAEVYEVNNKKEEAVRCYEKIRSEYPQCNEAVTAEAQLARLN